MTWLGKIEQKHCAQVYACIVAHKQHFMSCVLWLQRASPACNKFAMCAASSKPCVRTRNSQRACVICGPACVHFFQRAHVWPCACIFISTATYPLLLMFLLLYIYKYKYIYIYTTINICKCARWKQGTHAGPHIMQARCEFLVRTQGFELAVRIANLSHAGPCSLFVLLCI